MSVKTHTCSLTSLCWRFTALLSCIIKADKPGPGPTGTPRPVCLCPSREARASPRQTDVLLSPAPVRMSPLRREAGEEAKRCNWIAGGTQQCGKGKREEIRRLVRGAERAREKPRQEERYLAPRTQRMDVRRGINSWIHLLSRSFVTAAGG